MVHELRIYRCVPGRLPDLLARFRNHTLKLWEKHGIRQAGFWTTLVGSSNQDLHYLLAWELLAERETKWAAFLADPDWQAVRAQTEANGQIVANVENLLLAPTDFVRPVSLAPTFATPPGFLGIARADRAADYVVAGIPLDLGVTNRAGARDGPAAIRRASRMLVDGAHPVHWVDPAALPLADIGDFALALGDLERSLARIEEQATGLAHLVALGGEHGVTLPLLRALRARLGAPLGLLQFDAHLDTWGQNFGQRFAHGAVFLHAIEEGLVDPARFVQVGIRSPVDRATWDWTIGRGVTVIDAQTVHEAGPVAISARVRAVLGDSPCYLSFDIDALDPAFAPGTGTPEVGGLASWQAQGIIRRLGGLRWVGMDVVEVAPAYDTAEITALAAATMAWEYLALIGSG